MDGYLALGVTKLEIAKMVLGHCPSLQPSTYVQSFLNDGLWFSTSETIFACVVSKTKSLRPLGRLTVEKTPQTCLLYPQDIVAFLICSRQLPKSIQPNLTLWDICSYLWGRKDSAPLRGGSRLRVWEVLLLSVGTDTAATRKLKTHSGICHLFILGFIVLQCKHIKHML